MVYICYLVQLKSTGKIPSVVGMGICEDIPGDVHVEDLKWRLD